jgi:hypothetical protein
MQCCKLQPAKDKVFEVAAEKDDEAAAQIKVDDMKKTRLRGKGRPITSTPYDAPMER